ncbi:uncharacterized protein A4U43_C03F5160 [Asparagus officinalis]|uniref:Bifunctional inhibitor/plant lipid transfer protein/seed storage helical domain-containing protein n=2 Tax=Asparagus officinalis TaxID=4686 RepID=A0A5P1F9B9_ASPOF|nr:uncharacterized protein A4U43_C03F5160 [Asparagus officinalis]
MKTSKVSTKAISMAIMAMAMSMNLASAQVTSACTSSLISSFTPCLNFLTGSTNGGGSPTAGCCQALGSLISSSTDCACLMLTGSVPLTLPINRTLAINLPRICGSTSVPLQCKATATPVPGPGPIAYAPGLPPLPPTSGGGLDSVPPAAPPAETELPTSPSADGPAGVNQGQRPFVLPNSAVKLSPALFLVLVLGALFAKI